MVTFSFIKPPARGSLRRRRMADALRRLTAALCVGLAVLFGLEAVLAVVETEPMAPAQTAGAPRPVKIVIDRSVGRDFGQGTLRQTGAPFDLGLDGNGFFKVRTPDGEQFTRDGRYALVSIMENPGELVVVDARTLREVKSLPMSKPIGKYNVFNKVTRSEGTSH